MSDAAKAVFLSYASQDADAAKKICDALRAAGVEVWFDQSELVGGDAWDANIRKQIKECALLIPVISAATQARTEGYFRLEWRLADQRTHLMAKGRAFLLPVVIDDTRDAGAHVPDSFTEVQWTRLPGGETTAAFAARVKKLLGGTAAELAEPTPTSARPAAVRSPNSRGVLVRAWIMLALVIGIGAYFLFKPRRSVGAIGRIAVPAQGSGSKPEVADLLAKVRASLNRIDVLHADLDTMEGLLGQAAKIDPADASIWAQWALLDCRYLSELYDPSAGRREAARRHAAQANGLDPTRPEVRLAQAVVMTRLAQDEATNAASEKILRALLVETPENGEIPLALGWLSFKPARPDAALAWFDRAAQIPGHAARAHFAKGIVLANGGRLPEAVPEFDRALAAERAVGILLWKAYILTVWEGDLAAANRALEEVPPQFFVEDMPAVTRYYVLLLSRKYDGALAAMRAVPHDYLQSVAYSGPAGYFKGYVLALSGRSAAAELEWRSALATVEQRLAAQPNEQEAMQFKALLQAALGDRGGALRTYRAVHELYADIDNQVEQLLTMQLLPADDAIKWTAQKVAKGDSFATAAQLRLDPAYDPIRSDPRFAALLAQAEADPRLSPNARAKSVASAPAAADDKSIAVLAFANLSDDKANEYFSDGISEELLNVLAKVPKLKVAARTSSFYFKGRNEPIPEIAQKLGVAYVVEGSVRKSGNKVRITAQLIKAADGFHVWSETYDRELQDIFAVQDEIAKNILRAVKGSLLGETELPHATTTRPEAYTLFLQGQGELAKRGVAGLREAIRLFEAALAIDPGYVPALVGLGRAAVVLPNYAGLTGQPARDLVDKAKAVARRALELEPDNAGAHAVIGWALSAAEWHWSEGAAELRRARELGPNDPWVQNLSGDFYRWTGDYPASIAAKRLAWGLDPLSANSHWDLGYAYTAAGDYDQAIHWGELAIGLAPHNLDSYQPVVLAAAHSGRFDLMRRTLVAARQNVHEDEGFLLLYEVIGAIVEKRATEAHQLLAKAKRLADAGQASPAYIGYCHLLLGESADARRWLQRGYDQRDQLLVWTENIDFDVIAANPETRPVLDQPGLKELYELRQRNARAGANKP